MYKIIRMTLRYIFPSDKERRFDLIENKIRKTYPNSCIVELKEVINEELMNEFKKYEHYLKTNYGKDKILRFEGFHGTSSKCIQPICSEGFRMSKNMVSAFGKGTYIARDAIYSFNYMKDSSEGLSCMFLCDILTIGLSTSIRDDIPIDYCHVDNLENPSIFSIPTDCAIYPKYLISFHKEAK